VISKLRLSKPAVDEIALLLAADVEPQKIVHSFHCHAATVHRIKQNVDTFGETRLAPVSIMGRPRKITAEVLEGLLDWLLENSDDKALLYLDKIVAFLEEEYKISALNSTVYQALLNSNITYKAVSIILNSLNFDLLYRLNDVLLSEIRLTNLLLSLDSLYPC
jgi:transposase